MLSSQLGTFSRGESDYVYCMPGAPDPLAPWCSAHQSVPLAQASAEPEFTRFLPGKARGKVVPLAAFGIGHRPVLAPGGEDMQGERIVFGAGFLEGSVGFADGGTEVLERLLQPFSPHVFT